MEMKRGFLLTSFITGRVVRSTHLLTITFGLYTCFPCKFSKKNVFLYNKYLRDYIQLYSQLSLSEFIQNISFCFKIFSLRKVKPFY